MSKKLSFILIFLNAYLFAQPGKEAGHWYFGAKSKVDFSSGTPVGGQGIPTAYISGGAASISDENTGQYLFTAGSTKVYNRNNVVMYNGYSMFSGLNSTQNLIVRQPGSNTLYYVITPDMATLNSHGVTYSVIDMSLQGGLGAVAIKNKLLTPSPATEKVAAVRHCNGIDYWVITHSGNSNAFNAYLLNASGLDTIPVVSHVGVTHQFLHWDGSSYFEGIGCMKASPNGKKIAVGIQSDSIPVMEIFDFDNSTGMLSNAVTINYPGNYGPYGLSFSPDNSKLYSIIYHDANHIGPGDTTLVYQYDLSNTSPGAIIASQQTIYLDLAPTTLGEMQIAPDGKIYIARFYKDTLAAINNPNASGLACNFQIKALFIFPSSVSYWNLPNFIDANYAGIQINVPDIQLCTTFTTTVADAGPGYTSYQWSTGATTQTISVNAPGQYWVTVTNDQGCARTDTVGAYVLLPLKEDTIACDTFHANVTQGGVLQYNWYDATHNPTHSFTQSGNYYVDIAYVNGCGIRDSLYLTIVQSPQINIGPDTAFCKGSLEVNAYCSTCTYQWSTGATSSSITATHVNTYWVKVTDANGCTDSDTMVVHPQVTAFNFTMPNVVTPNEDGINDVIDFGRYQFSEFQIQIFNRWGKLVFESDSADAVWKPAGDDGTYFYTGQCRIDCGIDSRTQNIKGYITLTR